MARSTREQVKRKLKSLVKNTDAITMPILSIAEMYKETHPEIHKRLNDVAEMYLIVQTLLEELEGTI